MTEDDHGWWQERAIVHVDMDAFFAAVEQRDHPELAGRPVVIGGDPRSRGVVSTASYEARKFGIHSAMPVREAQRRCPDAVFLPANHARYRAVSRQIRDIMAAFSSIIEPLSIDEAFLDVSGRDPVAVARAIKQRIRRETGLTASVGVSYNKFLAKLASDMDKPDGLTVISPDRARRLLPTLPVQRLWGVGPRTRESLEALQIETIGDLLAADPAGLRPIFGRRLPQMLDMARGIDHRPVETSREVHSISEETTFPYDVSDPRLLWRHLKTFARNLETALRRQGLRGRTVVVKVRYSDFQTITRSSTSPLATDGARQIAARAANLLARIDLSRRIRLIGLGVAGLEESHTPQQMAFEFMDQIDLLLPTGRRGSSGTPRGRRH